MATLTAQRAAAWIGGGAAAERELRGDPAWKALHRVGGAAAIATVALIPIQLAVFIAWPPPTTVAGFYAMFEQNALVGLLALDLLLMVSWLLAALVFLGIYVALRRASPSLMAIATVLELVAVAMYFSSNTAFSMLTLSGQYAAAGTDAERSVLIGAGQAMLALYTGTAFNVSYVLSGVAVLIAGVVSLRSGIFGRAASYAMIVYGVLQLPPTAGAVGLVFSILSLVPMVAWLILVARRLLQLAGASDGPMLREG